MTSTGKKSHGTVYLLHFDKPLSHARHYIGFANGEGLESRIDRHRAGTGAKIMAAVARAGIGFEVVRTWERDSKTGRRASRQTERDLKNMRSASSLCPVCREEKRGRKNRLARERYAGRPRLGVPWALSPGERAERDRESGGREEVSGYPETSGDEWDDIPF